MNCSFCGCGCAVEEKVVATTVIKFHSKSEDFFYLITLQSEQQMWLLCCIMSGKTTGAQVSPELAHKLFSRDGWLLLFYVKDPGLL